MTDSIDRARPLLGTLAVIRAGGLDAADAHHVINRGFSEIADIHHLMSFHEADSDVSRLNRAALDGPVTVDPRTITVLRTAITIGEASAGLFDITIAPQLVAWGFLPKPESSHTPDAAASWRDIELIGEDKVRFHKPLWIDLGGIAKGFAVDRAIERMQAEAAGQYLVNAGGDLRVSGPVKERIFLRVPSHPGGDVPAVDIENGSVASSSGQETARRHEARLVGPHIHGQGRRSVGTRSFVSVLTESCMIADALTKIVLAQGPRSSPLLKRFGAAAYFYNARHGWRILGAIDA